MRKYEVHLKATVSTPAPVALTVDAEDIEINTDNDMILLNFTVDNETVGLVPLENVVAVVSEE